MGTGSSGKERRCNRQVLLDTIEDDMELICFVMPNRQKSSEQVEEPDEELINAQHELEIAMDQNAERGAVLDSQLQDVMSVIQTEDRMSIDEFKTILDAKEQEIRRTE